MKYLNVSVCIVEKSIILTLNGPLCSIKGPFKYGLRYTGVKMSTPVGQGRSSARLSDYGSQCGLWLIVALGLRESVAGRILETSGGPWKSPTAQEAKLREPVATRRLFVSDLAELWGVVTKILVGMGCMLSYCCATHWLMCKILSFHTSELDCFSSM